MSEPGGSPEGGRTLGVLGTLVWDTVWHPGNLRAGGGPVEQWGGLTYSLVALAAVCPPGWRVVPIVKVGRDLAGSARDFLSGLPNLELGPGVRVVPEPNNRVELRYSDAAHRHERLTGGVPAWRWDELAPLLRSVDALYLNFITGLELDLPTLSAVRRSFRGPIYTDLHSLFLGPPGTGARTPRALPDAGAWLACCDAVQLNERELSLLTGRSGDPLSLAAELVRGEGPLLAAVTLGDAGAGVARVDGLPGDPLGWKGHRPDRGRPPVVERVPVEGGAAEGDPTGCGDVWGGVFWSGLLAGLPTRRAAARANGIAALKVRHPETAALFPRLREALRGPPA